MARVAFARQLSDNSAFARAVEEATAKKAAKAINGLDDEIEQEANRLMDQLLVTDRSGRNRKNGARHFKGSVKAFVEWDGVSFPVLLGVTSASEERKVAALEFGSKQHVIPARDGGKLAFPSTPGRATEIGLGQRVVRLESGRTPGSRARGQGYAAKKGGLARPEVVLHPGNRAYGILGKALANVVKRRLANKVL